MPTVPGTYRLSPAFVEWMMGLDGHVTGTLGLSRAAQLHLLGNSVIPQQAAQALEALLSRGRDLTPGCQEIAHARHLGTNP